MNLQLSHIAYPVQSLGPGRRVAIWVAGCSIGCPGCITPQLWSKNAGRTIKTERLAQRLNELENLDGITLTGGEPFEQAAQLVNLLTRMRRAKPAWNVLSFTGFPMASVARRQDRRALLSQVDLLIAGPYKANKLDMANKPAHRLIASSNQRIHALTARGERMAEQAQLTETVAELGFVGRSQAWLIGILDPEERRAVLAANGLDAELQTAD